MLVSILIPCWNAERWIGHAIDSALAQRHAHTEVIVVDDGSTDGSLDVIERYAGRIRFEACPHRGGNVARNRLLELARGAWLQYLDADDCLLPDKISAQAEFLAREPHADVVFGPVVLKRDGERRILPIPEPHDPWRLLARWYLPQTGAALWRRQAIVDVGGWKPDQPCCQEHELYLRLLMAGKRFAYCAAPGAVYRQWSEDTVCRRDKGEVRRRRLDIEQRIETFLRERSELTAERLRAINQARFEIARLAWQHDRAQARAVMADVRRSLPGFRPQGDAAPGHYRLLYRLLGFGPTEVLADCRRKLFRGAMS